MNRNEISSGDSEWEEWFKRLWAYGLGVVALVQVAAAATTIMPAALPGEYRRSFDLDALVGLTVTLHADGSFSAIASGNTAKMPQTDIDVGEIGSASGHWELFDGDLRLVPAASSGVLATHYLRYRVEQCASVPALLPAEEVMAAGAPAAMAGMPPLLFTRLLLKERVVRSTPADSNERKAAEQNWAEVTKALLNPHPTDSARFVGKIVAFQGMRANGYDTAELRVEVKMNGSRILCRVHNSIDGTRLAEFWTAGMVGVSVRGEIVKIDHAARSVEIQPLEAGPTWAR